MNSALLRSIQVGLPQQFGSEAASDPLGAPWTSGICKRPAAGPVWLGRLNLEGDGQADLVHHGGQDKAVCAYSADHYERWRADLNLPTLPLGAFGENFTMEGLTEDQVCIGDVWKIGDRAVVQVSQPRQPCWKLSRRWRIKALTLQVQQTGFTGWYFRVLTEGQVAAGMQLTLVQRPHPEWTVERANWLMHHDKANHAAAAELAAISLLSASWRKTMSGRARAQLQNAQARPD